jgi:hypothetical protein
MSKVKIRSPSYKHHTMKRKNQVERLLTKLLKVPILNPGRDTDSSETVCGCFTQHAYSSTVPLHRPRISSLYLQIHES